MLVKIFINNEMILSNFDDQLITNYNEDPNLDETFISELYSECARAFPDNDWYDIVCDGIEYCDDYIKAYVSTFSNNNSDSESDSTYNLNNNIYHTLHDESDTESCSEENNQENKPIHYSSINTFYNYYDLNYDNYNYDNYTIYESNNNVVDSDTDTELVNYNSESTTLLSDLDESINIIQYNTDSESDNNSLNNNVDSNSDNESSNEEISNDENSNDEKNKDNTFSIFNYIFKFFQ